MKDIKKFEYSGDLALEMQEAEKLCSSMEDIERGRTFTFECTGLLTIICC